MAYIITHAKDIQRKSRHLCVRQVRANWYTVLNPQSGKTYHVNLGLNGGTCNCPWGRRRPVADHRSGCAVGEQRRRLHLEPVTAAVCRRHRKSGAGRGRSPGSGGLRRRLERRLDRGRRCVSHRGDTIGRTCAARKRQNGSSRSSTTCTRCRRPRCDAGTPIGCWCP